jgi:hypothetical protein
MSTEIARYEQPLALIQSIDDLARLSKQVADSNYYQGTDSAAQASVKLMIARELGLGITSISNIHLVKGKISLGYQILIALVKRSGKYDMRFVERTETCVRIEWYEDGKVVGTSKFDMDDARRAGLSGDNYRKFPIRMLTARAVSDGFNTFAPECAGGALYTDGEIPEDDNPAPARRTRAEQSPPIPSSETVIDVEPVAAAPVATAAAEATPIDPPVAESAAATAPSIPEQTEACKLVVKAMTKKQLEVVRECVEHLGIAWDAATPFRLVERFGADATEQDSLLLALHAAVTPPETIEGEVEPWFGDKAEAFQQHLNEDADKTARDIAAAEEKRDAISAKLAAAGSYGES